MLKAILACDDNWGIGKDGGLPWPHNSADLRWFKKLTERQMIIMGRNTWESLPVRPLGNRMNVVITNRAIEGNQPDRVFTLAEFKDELPDLKPYKDRYIIGGAKLVNECFDIIDEFLISRISGVYDCDTYLPAVIFESVYKKVDSYTEDGVNVERWVKI
jgi:dihydrofolate reductase